MFMTLRETLSAISPYPLPADLLGSVGREVGVNLDDDMTAIPVTSFYKAEARVYMFLATMPNISEGGVSISFTAQDKSLFLSMARRLAAMAGDKTLVSGVAYGYKGEDI